LLEKWQLEIDMSQKTKMRDSMDKLELVLSEALPYVSDIEYAKELILNSKDLEELKEKINKLIKEEKDITKKTDLRIILEKIEEIERE